MKHVLCLMVLLGWMASGAMAGEAPVNIEPEKLTEVPNAGLLREGLVSGGAPTARGLGQAAEQGIRTVIDLRKPEEGTAQEADYAEAVGLKYLNIPLSAADFSEAQADRLKDALKDPATGPTLLHCASGQRVAAVWALYRNRHEGVSASAAMEEARKNGLQKPELITKLETLLK